MVKHVDEHRGRSVQHVSLGALNSSQGLLGVESQVRNYHGAVVADCLQVHQHAAQTVVEGHWGAEDGLLFVETETQAEEVRIVDHVVMR